MKAVLEVIKSKLNVLHVAVYQERPVTAVTIVAKYGDKVYAETGSAVRIRNDPMEWNETFGINVARGKAYKKLCQTIWVHEYVKGEDISEEDGNTVLDIPSEPLFPGNNGDGYRQSPASNFPLDQITQYPSLS